MKKVKREQQEYERLLEYSHGDSHLAPPEQASLHVALPWCWCRPEITYEHPVTFHRVWSHRYLVH